jgi:trehalose 6-phosphate synthase/phosphatase
MFRALRLFPDSRTKTILEPPLSVTLPEPDRSFSPVNLDIAPDAIFTTAVGHSSKKTLASWHVTTATEVVEHLLDLVSLGEPEEDVKSNL